MLLPLLRRYSLHNPTGARKVSDAICALYQAPARIRDHIAHAAFLVVEALREHDPETVERKAWAKAAVARVATVLRAEEREAAAARRKAAN